MLLVCVSMCVHVCVCGGEWCYKDARCVHPAPPQAVDYAAIGRSPQFEDYLQTTAELKRADVKSLSRPEKIAFFCNVYNALVIHAFVVHGPPTNIFKRLRVRRCHWGWQGSAS